MPDNKGESAGASVIHKVKEHVESAPQHVKFALVNMFKTIIVASFLSFLISESAYLFLLNISTSNFHLILVISLMSIIAGTAIVDLLFSDEIAIITLLSSASTIAIIINFIFSNSPKPQFFPFGDSMVSDAGIMMLLSIISYFFLNGIYDRARSKKMSTKHICMLILVVGSLVAMIGIYPYYHPLVSFFDDHPWIIAILVSIISGIASFLYGRKTREVK